MIIKKLNRKSKALLPTWMLILLLVIGGTIAFIVVSTLSVTNAFNPSEVTCAVIEAPFDEEEKRDVKIQNTGDIPAYIRAELVFSWQDADGNILGLPVTKNDYTITFGSDSWIEKDGFYYYNKLVAADGLTKALIIRCSPKAERVPAGYYLSVEVIGSAIQADGVNEDNEKAVFDAWGVDPSTLQ